jgi:hypothetical protein
MRRKGFQLHLTLWEACNGSDSEWGIINKIGDCEAQGIAWWICPEEYNEHTKEPVFCHLNLNRPRVLRYAWFRIARQVSLLDKFGRTAEEHALEIPCPLSKLSGSFAGNLSTVSWESGVSAEMNVLSDCFLVM